MRLAALFPRTRHDVLARAIRHDDWHTAALVVLVRIVDATHALPPGDVEDVLALISAEDKDDLRG